MLRMLFLSTIHIRYAYGIRSGTKIVQILLGPIGVKCIGANGSHLMFDGRELDVALSCGVVIGVRMKQSGECVTGFDDDESVENRLSKCERLGVRTGGGVKTKGPRIVLNRRKNDEGG